MECTPSRTRSKRNETSTEVNYPKTPYNIRARVKKQLVNFSEGSADDYTDEDSDFKISEEDSDSTSNDEDEETEDEKESTENEDGYDSGSNEDEEVKQTKYKEALNVAMISAELEKVCRITPKSNSTAKRKTRKYVIKTDEYFSSHSSRKIVTSNNTLDKLKTPKLEQGQLQKLLLKLQTSKHHTKCLKELGEFNKSCFVKWLGLLHEGFNLLLYGLGSKRNILLDFQEEFLSDQPVIVVNGFFPSLTLKNIMDSILVDVLESSHNPSNFQEGCDTIAQLISQNTDLHLYILFNNIDGSTLRSGKAQNVLARLASIQNLHLVATIDHINAPIIWDQSRTSKFNFVWWDVTSFQPYLNETSFEDSLLVQHSGSLALSSLNNVFMSLTKNAKSIYLIIVKHQLENKKNQHYEGLLFKDLYWACREAFLVSSDLALRAQLTEFVDHKMVKFKRFVSGGEHLVIPIHNILLQQFLDEQSS